MLSVFCLRLHWIYVTILEAWLFWQCEFCLFQEQEISFHFVMFPLIFFFRVLYFSLWRSFTFLVRLNPKCFIFLESTMSDIVFTVSFSLGSLLIYTNGRYFTGQAIRMVNKYMEKMFNISGYQRNAHWNYAEIPS